MAPPPEKPAAFPESRRGRRRSIPAGIVAPSPAGGVCSDAHVAGTNDWILNWTQYIRGKGDSLMVVTIRTPAESLPPGTPPLDSGRPE